MKKVAVISMVKNEQDIIESFVRHCLSFADIMLLCNHMSSDKTGVILSSLQAEGLPIILYREDNPAHIQAEVMTRLMHQAVESADIAWVIPLDADEFLLPVESSGRVRRAIQQLDTGCVYQIPWRIYGLQEPHSDEEVFLLSRPLLRASQDEPGYKILLSGELARNEDIKISEGNHHVFQRQPDGSSVFLPSVKQTQVMIAHFCWRTPEQYAAKVAVGWPNIVAKYSLYTNSGGHYKKLWQQLIEQGLPDMAAILPEKMNPVIIPAEIQAQELHYSRNIRPNAMRNLMSASVDMAKRCIEERVADRHRKVTIILPYLGDLQKLKQTLECVSRQTYPYRELFILELESLEPEAKTDLLGSYEKAVFLSDIVSQDVFAQLSARATGVYVQWLLPGAQVYPQRLREMVTTFETQDQRFALLVSEENERDDRREMCLSFLYENKDPLTMGYRKAWWSFMLAHGKYPAGGLTSALIRREIMDNRQWLKQCFMDSRPLYFAMWYQLLQELPADGSWQLIGIMNCAYQYQQEESTIVDDMFHQLEWECLLEEAQDSLDKTEKISAFKHLLQEVETVMAALNGAALTGRTAPLSAAYREMVQQLRERIS